MIASIASPSLSSSSDSGATVTPDPPDACRITVSEGDSWPSTEIRSNERLTQTLNSNSHVCADIAASVCTKHSNVANPGEIIPAPFAWAVTVTAPDGSATRTRARFSNASVVWIASEKWRSPSVASALPAAWIPLVTRSIGSGTPITPVEATATRLGCTPVAVAASSCIFCASS